MSRSIHETRKSWARLRRFDFSKPEDKAIAVDAALRRLWKKRRIKNAVNVERHSENPPIEPVPVHLVQIRIDDAGPLVHHGASVQDIQGLLQTMPSMATEGIREIHLRLGKAYMDEQAESDTEEHRDPYFGRRSQELLPGLYSPPVLGTCSHTGLITISALVWDKALNLNLPVFVPEFYFRLLSFSVLIHEIAHHHDHVHRVARGRWLSDRKNTSEHYAEKMEWEWMHDFVFPYIERRYEQEWEEVQAWVIHYGGAKPTLEQLGGNPRCTTRDGLTRFATSTSEAILGLMKDLAEGRPLVESRLNYARNLHYADQYEPCLEITSSLIEITPLNAKVLSLHADTLEHLERLPESLNYVEQAIALDPLCAHAWKTKALLMEDFQNWSGLLEACDGWCRGLPLDKSQIFVCRSRAVGLCALGRHSEMEEILNECLQERYRHDAKILESVRRLIFKRARVAYP